MWTLLLTNYLTSYLSNSSAKYLDNPRRGLKVKNPNTRDFAMLDPDVVKKNSSSNGSKSGGPIIYQKGGGPKQSTLLSFFKPAVVNTVRSLDAQKPTTQTNSLPSTGMEYNSQEEPHRLDEATIAPSTTAPSTTTLSGGGAG